MKKAWGMLLLSLAFAAPARSMVQPPAENTGRKEMAITFDDLPATHGDIETWEAITAKLLAGIRKHRAPAIGFVNEGKLYRNEQLNPRAVALMQRWLDAGLELGNHTYSHISIDQAPLELYKQDVIRGESVLRRLLKEKGRQLRYFRHTQLRTGPTMEYKRSLEKFMSERGYTTAPVTIDSNEYLFAAVYSSAKARNDRKTMERVSAAYFPYMEQVTAHFEKLSQSLLGYQVKQTLLLHANELNADHFDRLAEMMTRRGYSFISLEQALTDPAYRLPDAQSTRGLSWIHRWMLAKGLRMEPEPAEPKFIMDLLNEGRR